MGNTASVDPNASARRVLRIVRHYERLPHQFTAFELRQLLQSLKEATELRPTSDGKLMDSDRSVLLSR